MSELKSFILLYDGKFIRAYEESEADKAITELKEKLNNSRNARKYWRKEYLIEYKECSYQKYKRCLAMAKLCHWKMGVFIYKEEKSNFYHRWHERWLKIAEQFKETK